MLNDTKLRAILNPTQPSRTSGLTGLSNLDEDESAELRRVLFDVPVERRRWVAQSLNDLAEDNATFDFEAVFTILLDDEDPHVRRLAIDGLWEVDDRWLIEPLICMLQGDPDEGVRATAALALGRYVVLNEFGEVRARDADSVIDALRGAIDDPNQRLEVRARAVEAAGASSASWAEDMIWRAFDAGEPRFQVSAIHAMGRNANPDWLPTLFTEMESSDPQRRFEAAGAAGRIGDEDAIPHLVDLIEDEDAEVQEAAIAALGDIGGDAAVEVLRSHLQNADARIQDAIRTAIAEALAAEGLAGPPQIRPVGDDDEDDDYE